MEYLTFCPKYVALKQPGIFLTWETCYGWIAVCELFIFSMFLLIPKLPSRTGRVGREDPEIPNSPLSLFPPSILFSQEPSPAVAERSAGSLAFCTVSSNVDDFQGWHYIWREPEGRWQMNCGCDVGLKSERMWDAESHKVRVCSTRLAADTL